MRHMRTIKAQPARKSWPSYAPASLPAEKVHPVEVVRCHEHFPDFAEPCFTASNATENSPRENPQRGHGPPWPPIPWNLRRSITAGSAAHSRKAMRRGPRRRAGELADQEHPSIAHNVADFAHQRQFRRGEAVVKRIADPRDIHRFGSVAQCLDEIAPLEDDRTGERFKRRLRQVQYRSGEVDPVIMRDPCSLEALIVALSSPQAISKNRNGGTASSTKIRCNSL
jgi:hypothetical protein